MMHSMVLSQTQKPLVSLLEDYTRAQRHKGWEFGFLDGFANQTRKLHHLTWEVSPAVPPEKAARAKAMAGCRKYAALP